MRYARLADPARLTGAGTNMRCPPHIRTLHFKPASRRTRPSGTTLRRRPAASGAAARTSPAAAAEEGIPVERIRTLGNNEVRFPCKLPLTLLRGA